MPEADSPSTAGAVLVAAPAVALHGITKRYGAVTACDHVDLTLRAGEIHGILGENGAGKSTVMKILIGLVAPDEGRIELHGAPTVIHDPQTAAALGIGMVHQHLSLVDPLTVWENVVLGDRVRLNRTAARAQVRATAEHYGLDIDPDARVGSLSAGLRQRVELIKCLRRDPRIVILDEPTSVLTPAESEALFRTLRDVVAREQRAVALVSHKLAEVLHATDVVTIMRQGRVVHQVATAETDAQALATAMVGRRVSLRASAAAVGATDELEPTADIAHVGDANDAGEAGTGTTGTTDTTDSGTTGTADTRPVVLELRDVTVREHGVALLDGLSLRVHAGEIVGIAGVEGNGQHVLADVLSSLRLVDTGTIQVRGAAIRAGQAGQMWRHGVAVIPEDRHDSGCVLDMSVAENLLIDRIDQVAPMGLIDRAALHSRARQMMEEFDVQAAGPDQTFASLSGGNQQKVVLARELSQNPTVLVAAQPTRGLDVGAIEYMTARLRRAAAEGIGVLLISTELEEILDLSQRILVISRGRIIGDIDRAEATTERLGLLLGGMGDHG